jgi:hypothetical protein
VAVAALREASPATKVLAGGRAVAQLGAAAAVLGVDAVAITGSEAVDAARRLRA